MNNTGNHTVYYGRFSCSGEMIAAGKFIDCVLCLYGPDGKYHFSSRYQDQYYDGEFDEISDEEFEEFKKKMDAKGAVRGAGEIQNGGNSD